MRILQIIQQKQYRGAEIFCCQLSNHFLGLGHEVEIYSLYEGNASLPFLKEVKTLDRPKYKRYYDFKGWKELASIVNSFKPDIVQANAADTLKYTIFSRMICGWEVPIIFRNASPCSFYIKDVFSKKINSFLLKRADLIISVSEASKLDMNRIFPFTAPKCFVIPVGIETKEDSDFQYQFSKEHVNLIHVGSFTTEKNHLEMLNIFQEVKLKVPEARLHLIGGGPLLGLIEKEIRRSGLENFITCYGELEDPLDHIKSADVFILPSLIEGLPAVLLEAMYSKTQVVAYDVGGIGEIINKGTGRLVEKGNTEMFVSEVLDAIKRPSQPQIEKSYSVVKELFLNQEIAKMFLRAYKDLLSSKIDRSQ